MSYYFTSKAMNVAGTKGFLNGVKLFENTGSYSVTLQADQTSAMLSSYTLTFPMNDGAAGQVLTTDGSGILTWTTPSSGGGLTATVFVTTGSYTVTATTDTTFFVDNLTTAAIALPALSGTNDGIIFTFTTQGVGFVKISPDASDTIKNPANTTSTSTVNATNLASISLGNGGETVTLQGAYEGTTGTWTVVSSNMGKVYPIAQLGGLEYPYSPVSAAGHDSLIYKAVVNPTQGQRIIWDSYPRPVASWENSAPVIVSADTTLTAADHSIVLVNDSSPVTITLPTASGIAGKTFTIKKVNAAANTVTIDPDGTETIDGAATNTDLTSQYQAITFISNGSSSWSII
jgi:hypothetical protein